MCEQEIIKMYEYTCTTDEILDNVEKGVYKVERYQGKHGKSTTGHAATAATLNATAAASHREGKNIVIPLLTNFLIFSCPCPLTPHVLFSHTPSHFPLPSHTYAYPLTLTLLLPYRNYTEQRYS